MWSTHENQLYFCIPAWIVGNQKSFLKEHLQYLPQMKFLGLTQYNINILKIIKLMKESKDLSSWETYYIHELEDSIVKMSVFIAIRFVTFPVKISAAFFVDTNKRFWTFYRKTKELQQPVLEEKDKVGRSMCSTDTKTWCYSKQDSLIIAKKIHLVDFFWKSFTEI